MNKNNNKNFKLLNDWLLSLKLKEKKELKLEDIHIDELIGKKDNKTMFFRSLELFYDFIHLNFSYDFHINYVPSLVFSLEFSKKIALNIKNDIWDEFDYTPPSIYLAPKAYYLLPIEFEEYKKPLDLDVFKKFQRDCIVYYRCYRDIEYIQKNWREYGRSVHIDNFGKNKSI